MRFPVHFDFNGDTVRLAVRKESAAIRVFQLFCTNDLAPNNTDFVQLLGKRSGQTLSYSTRFYLNRSPALDVRVEGGGHFLELGVDEALWVTSTSRMSGFVLCEYVSKEQVEADQRMTDTPVASDNIAGEIGGVDPGDGI